MVDQLTRQHKLSHCIECGKCVAVCPMAKMFEDFSHRISPRGVIEKTVRGQEWLENVGVWFCFTCELCARICPVDVRFRDYIEAVRQRFIQAGITQYAAFCRDCGAYLWPRHTEAHLRQMLGETTTDYLALCPSCRRYDFGKKVKSQALGRRGRGEES